MKNMKQIKFLGKEQNINAKSFKSISLENRYHHIQENEAKRLIEVLGTEI